MDNFVLFMTGVLCRLDQNEIPVTLGLYCINTYLKNILFEVCVLKQQLKDRSRMV